jgi:hypothetical protein
MTRSRSIERPLLKLEQGLSLAAESRVKTVKSHSRIRTESHGVRYLGMISVSMFSPRKAKAPLLFLINIELKGVIVEDISIASGV